MSTQGGPAQAVSLQESGTVAGGPAQPVYLADGPVVGGSAVPVRIVTGRPVAGGPALPISYVSGGVTQGGPALPIAIMNPDAYSQKVIDLLGSSLIAYWPLSDLSGTTATDASGNGRNGTYSNVVLGQPGIGDGRTAASFNSTNSFCDVHSASLAAAFSGAEGAAGGWFQAANRAVWTDGTTRYFFQFQVNGSNLLYARKQAANNQLAFVYIAGGVAKTIAPTIPTPATWIHLVIAWSKSADVVLAYINGALVSAPPQTGLGVWAGTLLNTRTILGNSTTSASQACNACGAHAFVTSAAPTPATIAQLAQVGP